MLTLDIKDGRAVARRREEPAIEISLDAWRAGARPGGEPALILPNTVDVAEIAPALGEFAAIILEFPSFRDGRAYSQARILRERYGFKGEIRARGEILRDQALFMARAGFDAIEVAAERAAGASDALGEFSAFYQHGADGSEPVWRRRAPRSKAA